MARAARGPDSGSGSAPSAGARQRGLSRRLPARRCRQPDTQRAGRGQQPPHGLARAPATEAGQGAHLQLHAKPQVAANGHALLARHGHCSGEQRRHKHGADQPGQMERSVDGAGGGGGGGAEPPPGCCWPGAAAAAWAACQRRRIPLHESQGPAGLPAERDHLSPRHCTRKSAGGGAIAAIPISHALGPGQGGASGPPRPHSPT